ncbi:RNA polymerase sigma factor [Bifidobacterium indicum]|uniref:RNA polymerase sigma factor n=1 Tax=Bifidobacterium indicum TaxID=1691 RepID=UPI0026342330|nr:sigma-70 family RNA polymerase sigma factor [uncultured Bifidobacterium sp.]
MERSRIDPDTDDITLIKMVAAENESAFEALYNKYAHTVQAFISLRTSGDEDASEAFADTWLGCWRSSKSFRAESRVLTWILSIARRQIYMKCRKPRLPDQMDSEELDSIADDRLEPAELVNRDLMMETIREKIDALPREMAYTVTLAWLHELSYPEIASLLDIPVGTVKSRLARAKQILRPQLTALASGSGQRLQSRRG